VAGRQRGDAYIDRLAADAQRDAPVLRQTFFRDVELRHDLDARDQRGMDRLARLDDVAQIAVDTKAHDGNLLERFDVNIGCAFAQRLRQQRVDHANHRRIVGRFQQVLDGRHVLHDLVQIHIRFELDGDLRRIAACIRIGGGNRGGELVGIHFLQTHGTEAATDFGNRRRSRGVRYP
jgi:hypothetical protein